MNLIVNLVGILEHPKVKRYFLDVLDSNMPSRDKYDEFVDFFRRIRKLLEESYGNVLTVNDEGTMNRIVFEAAKEISVWTSYEMIGQVQESIERAVRRLGISQHSDGGWGFRIEQSECWATGHALLCLNSVKSNFGELDSDIDTMMKRGIDWLYEKRATWAVEDIPPDHHSIPVNERIFVYELSLVVICFCQIERRFFTEEFSSAVSKCIEKLIDYQNENGGWEEARNRDPADLQLRTGPGSEEVGATSWALRALAIAGETMNEDYSRNIEKAADWIIYAQNRDFERGSWNYVRSGREGDRLPSISKTCDALQALAAGEKSEIASETKARIDEAIKQAIEWLGNHVRPVLEDRETEGWAWMNDDFSSFDLENTCLTLETLVKMPNRFRPLLTPLLGSSARWLIKQQYKEKKNDERVKDDMDVGKWANELTARVTFALIEYYKTIKEDTSFGELGDEY